MEATTDEMRDMKWLSERIRVRAAEAEERERANNDPNADMRWYCRGEASGFRLSADWLDLQIRNWEENHT